MVITNLTNYLWTANATVDVSSLIGSTYNLTYTIRDTRDNNIDKQQTALTAGVTTTVLGTTHYLAGTNTNSPIEHVDNVIAIGLGSSTTNVTTFYALNRHFHITGGNDVTNSTLISFFEANGTLVKMLPEREYNLTEYGTYKVRVIADGYESSDFSNEVTYTAPEQKIDVSNKAYQIKTTPTFTTEYIIHGAFMSGGTQFSQISILNYENDWEIWYVGATSSVLAYSVGTWEIEYKMINFVDNVQIYNSDYEMLLDIYERYYEQIEFDLRTLILDDGAHTIKIKAIGDGINYRDSNYSNELSFNVLKFSTNIISLSQDILSTSVVEGVTMYKIYSDGEYIGYIDSANEWHEGGDE